MPSGRVLEISLIADGGATWTDRSSAGGRGWTAIASSADGSKLAATSENDGIWISTNGGATWTSPSFEEFHTWYGITFSVTFLQPAGVTGITYAAEWTPDLVADPWTPIPDTGSGGAHTFSVPRGSNLRMFFRYVITEQ